MGNTPTKMFSKRVSKKEDSSGRSRVQGSGKKTRSDRILDITDLDTSGIDEILLTHIQHVNNLVQKYNETIGGGYLVPYGYYDYEKLDFNILIVKNLIKHRKLAPFYIPLDGYCETWDNEKLTSILNARSFHQKLLTKLEEFEDIPVDIEEITFDESIAGKILTTSEKQ